MSLQGFRINGSPQLPQNRPHRRDGWIAYLCACAQLTGARLVTFDTGFRQYETSGLDLVLLAGKEK
jgi:hypothetical protein